MSVEPDSSAVFSPAGKPEKHRVQRAFGAAASRYDRLASLQRSVADRLLSALPTLTASCPVWADVGTGTGYCASHLCQAFPGVRGIALDLAEGMLRQSRAAAANRGAVSLVAADAEALPIADRCIDLVVSSLALQWCPEPLRAVAEFGRVLKPGCQVLCGTFGPGTLCELREAWARVDSRSHVNVFTGAEELIALAAAAGLEALAVERDMRVVWYPDVLALMRELKGLGANNVTENRSRALVGKGTLARMVGAYTASHGDENGVAATFEVIYGRFRRVDQ